MEPFRLTKRLQSATTFVKSAPSKLLSSATACAPESDFSSNDNWLRAVISGMPSPKNHRLYLMTLALNRKENVQK